MELTEEQRDALISAGIGPESLDSDMRDLAGMAEEMDGLFADMNGSNVRSKFERFTELSGKIADMDEKYIDPAATEILNEAFEDLTGLHPDDIDFDNLEKDLDDFTEAYNEDPEFAAAIDAGMGDYMDEFSDQMDEFSARTDSLNETRDILKQNHERETRDGVNQDLADDNVLDCETEECEDGQPEIQKLEALFERTLNLESSDLPPGEMLEIYEEFLDAYSEVVASYTLEDDDSEKLEEERYQAVKDEVDRIVGIPPNVFPDKGAHYHSMLAEEIKITVGEADVSSSDMSAENRMESYAMAASLMGYNSYSSVFEVDQAFVENLSGYSHEYLSERADFYYDVAADERDAEASNEETPDEEAQPEPPVSEEMDQPEANTGRPAQNVTMSAGM